MLYTALICVMAVSLSVLAFRAPVSAQPNFKKVPEFQQIKDLNGKAFSRASLKGVHTLIVFFSIYSEDAFELLSFAESVGLDADIQVASVNIDPSAEDVRSFVQQAAVAHSVILDLSLKVTGAFKVRKVPTVFLVGPKLDVIYAAEDFGEDEKQALLRELQRIPMPEVEAADVDGFSKKFNEKFLVSPDASVAEFLPGERQLVLYISGDSDLWVYDPQSDERHSVAAKVDSADWDPSGRKIVFSHIDKPGLWWKEIGADKAVRISPFGNKPSWSPDGVFIAFHVHENEVWVYHVEKKQRWRLKANGDKVSWSNDGRLLLVRSGGKTFLISPWAKMSLLKSLSQ